MGQGRQSLVREGTRSNPNGLGRPHKSKVQLHLAFLESGWAHLGTFGVHTAPKNGEEVDNA